TADSPHIAFFDLLWQALFAENVFFGQWIAFTCLGVAVQRQLWPDAAAALVAVLYPPFLSCAWVPPAVRRKALAGFFRAGPRCPKRPAEELRPLVESDLCRM